jgi:hypothetical protein
MNIEEIVTKLNDRKQRATYGAVAGILNVPPRSLMDGRPRNPVYSWVVAAENGRPTGYEENQIHPDCLRQIREGHKDVIKQPEALREWLAG